MVSDRSASTPLWDTSVVPAIAEYMDIGASEAKAHLDTLWSAYCLHGGDGPDRDGTSAYHALDKILNLFERAVRGSESGRRTVINVVEPVIDEMAAVEKEFGLTQRFSASAPGEPTWDDAIKTLVGDDEDPDDGQRQLHLKYLSYVRLLELRDFGGAAERMRVLVGWAEAAHSGNAEQLRGLLERVLKQDAGLIRAEAESRRGRTETREAFEAAPERQEAFKAAALKIARLRRSTLGA